MMTLAESACTLRLRGKLLPGEDAMPAVEPMQSAVLRFRKVSLLEPSFDWLSCNHAALMDRACDDGFLRCRRPGWPWKLATGSWTMLGNMAGSLRLRALLPARASSVSASHRCKPTILACAAA